MIAANVVSQNISATVSEGRIVAVVGGASSLSAMAAGGVGPPGPSGVTTLSGAADVSMQNILDGDVLRFENTRWRNYREENLTDGGNF